MLNLQGKIIPVADLRIKFRLARVANTELTCIVVVQVTLPDKSATMMGLIVDAVEEVLNIAAGDIEPTPDFGTAINTDYILGLAKVKVPSRPSSILTTSSVSFRPEQLEPASKH